MLVYKYDAIVFDLDGTLIDSAGIKTWAFGKLYESYGEDVMCQVIAWHKQHEGLSRFVKFRYWHEHFLREPYTESLEQELSERFSRLVVDAVIQANYTAGTSDFLETYYQQLPLYIASATPEFELHNIVACREMKHYFQGIYGSPQTKAEILKRILLEKKYNSDRILMVGDSLSDWEGAQSAGVKFLGIQAGEHTSLPGKTLLLKSLENLNQYIC